MVHIDVYFLSALAGVVALVWEALRRFRNSQTHNIEDIVAAAVRNAVREEIEPLDARLALLNTRLTVVETKMDMVIGGVAVGAAAVLHHPEPSRARVDYLLDSFREGSITEEEMDELKGHLHTIMNWEQHGDSLDGGAAGEPEFIIYPGEPTAAALMLATMDHVTNTGELRGLLDPPADSSEEAGA